MTDQLATLIRELGFPIAVAAWFMFRTDKRLDKILTLLRELVIVTKKHQNESNQ